MLRCECGEAMTTESATGRGGVRYHYYNCRAFLKGIGCRSHRMPVAELDRSLLDGILDKIFTPDNLRGILVDLKQSVSEWVKDHDARLQAMYAEVEDIDRRLRRLYESIDSGAGLALAEVAPRLRELRARRDALTGEIESAEAEVAPSVSLSDQEAENAAEMFREIVRDCEEPARIRTFLAGIVRRVVLSAGNLRVEYFPEKILNTGHNGPVRCEIGWLLELGSNQRPTD